MRRHGGDRANWRAAHGLKIVDDACHALGTAYVAEDGTASPIGANAFSDLSVFSFHPVKAIAMGEGGAVTTNDPESPPRLMRARNHGMTRDAREFANADDAFDADGCANPWYYELVEPGFNWRATDIQCALGLSQLAKLDRFLARRRALAAAYDELLAPYAPRLKPVARQRNCLPAWHLYAVLIDFPSLRHDARRVHAQAGRSKESAARSIIFRCTVSAITPNVTASPNFPAPIATTRARSACPSSLR